MLKKTLKPFSRNTSRRCDASSSSSSSSVTFSVFYSRCVFLLESKDSNEDDDKKTAMRG